MSAEYQDVNQKFRLGTQITDEQRRFYETFGFVHFKQVFDEATIIKMREAIDQASAKVIDQRISNINGVPIKFGFNAQEKMIPQRTPFMNQLSPYINSIVTSPVLEPLLQFIPNSRFGFRERDGVVINHYVNAKKSRFKKLGWHNDSLRDIFYLEKIRPMLNVGIGLYPSSKTMGGLRVLPGSHDKGLMHMLFGKVHIFDNEPDPKEVAVEVEIGDVTLHDGRMWHRAQAPSQKLSFERKSLYFPILCGPYKPKNEQSPPPLYLRFMSGAKLPKDSPKDSSGETHV